MSKMSKTDKKPTLILHVTDGQDPVSLIKLVDGLPVHVHEHQFQWARFGDGVRLSKALPAEIPSVAEDFERNPVRLDLCRRLADCRAEHAHLKQQCTNLHEQVENHADDAPPDALMNELQGITGARNRMQRNIDNLLEHLKSFETGRGNEVTTITLRLGHMSCVCLSFPSSTILMTLSSYDGQALPVDRQFVADTPGALMPDEPHKVLFWPSYMARTGTQVPDFLPSPSRALPSTPSAFRTPPKLRSSQGRSLQLPVKAPVKRQRRA
jgi:hypothetical protein